MNLDVAIGTGIANGDDQRTREAISSQRLYLCHMVVLLADVTAPIVDGQPFFVLAAALGLLGIGVRVWLGQGGGSVGELATTKWLGRLLVAGVALIVGLLLYLIEWLKSYH